MAFPLADAEHKLVVEIDPADVSDLVLASQPDELVEKARTSLESALKDIQPGVQTIVDQLRSSEPQPDEATLEFGLKVGGQAGFVVARGTAEVNFVVKLTWK